MDNILEEVMKTVEQFKKDTNREVNEVIVSSEIFAKLMPALKNIRVDKTYSTGRLGSILVRSDKYLLFDTIIATKAPENDDFPYGALLPAIPPFHTVYKKKKKK